MQINIKKLDTVSLLLEIDNPQSDYQTSQLEVELKNRNLNKDQLQRAYNQKDYVQKQRAQKAEAPLSLMYKIFIIAFPFTDSKKMMHKDSTMVGEYEEFIEQAGYENKARQIKKYRRISFLLWILIFLALNIYVILTR
ncbi:MAG: hypothetical protein HEP71_09760 [Roseivirga sp.]|nr:hypothetical protein [Roseivirga sp.]